MKIQKKTIRGVTFQNLPELSVQRVTDALKYIKSLKLRGKIRGVTYTIRDGKFQTNLWLRDGRSSQQRVLNTSLATYEGGLIFAYLRANSKELPKKKLKKPNIEIHVGNYSDAVGDGLSLFGKAVQKALENSTKTERK